MSSEELKRNINKPTGETPPAKKFGCQSSSQPMQDVGPWPGSAAQNAGMSSTTPVQGGGGTMPGSATGATGVETGSENNELQKLMKFMERDSAKRDQQHD